MPRGAYPAFAGAVAVEGVGGFGVVGVRDGIDMPGMGLGIPPDGIPGPDAWLCPPISWANATLERMADAIAVPRTPDRPLVLSIVGPSPRTPSPATDFDIIDGAADCTLVF
jgi:hypothetical protein